MESKSARLAVLLMKLSRARNDDLVTIRFEGHYAIAEAGTLKRSGFERASARLSGSA